MYEWLDRNLGAILFAFFFAMLADRHSTLAGAAMTPEAAPRTAAGRALLLWLRENGLRQPDSIIVPYILAIEAEAAAGTALDVERLARAEHEADFAVPCIFHKEPFEKCGLAKFHRERAADLVAAYDARLAGVESR